MRPAIHHRLSGALSGVFLLAWLGCATASAPVVVLTVEGAISPGTADYVVRGLKSAADESAQLVILKMDTPGGLDTSMRQIIRQIVASAVPVSVYVAPDGARAASAGTYILYASHVAAMARATNLGAATPVMTGIGALTDPDDQPGAHEKKGGVTANPGTAMERKQVNDAAAYMRSLAQMRGRNVEWGELAVRQSVSLTATEALKLRVIDVIASDIPDLLRQLDGRHVTVLGVERTLNTAGAQVTALNPDWRSRLLSVIADPSIAYLLMLAGIFGLFFEFSNPGFVLPGVAGLISLLLALFAFQVLPVSYAGLSLIIIGIAFITTEVFTSSFGVFGAGGIVAFVMGSVMLIQTDVPGYGVPWQLIVPVALASAMFVFLVAGMALKAHKGRVVSGREEMIGSAGEVLDDFDGKAGWARVHGETWRIKSSQPLQRKQKIRGVRMDGLILEVTAENA